MLEHKTVNHLPRNHSSSAIQLHIVVIGSGIVGSTVACKLASVGHRVTIVDPEGPGSRRAASFGHASWISSASVVPMSMPGLWRQVPRLLLDRNGPLTIRWRELPRLLPWLTRFVMAGHSVANVEKTALALSQLLNDAPARHTALAEDIGAPELIKKSGLLYIYPDRKSFLAEELSWRLRRNAGVSWSELDEAALREREPDLAPRYRFGVLVENASHCIDPVAYVQAIVGHLPQQSTVFRKDTVSGFELTGGRLKGVRVEDGTIACDRAVICAGVWSKELAAQAGDVIPLESERGYHAVITSPNGGPRTPIMPSDGRMGNTMTRAGLRVAGQVELASVDAAPDWRRLDILLRQAVSTYPALGRVEELSYTRWFGHRPSTSDGLPVIGPSTASTDIIHAFGHGHVGFASAPFTAAAVEGLVAGRSSGFNLHPYRAGRFR